MLATNLQKAFKIYYKAFEEMNKDKVATLSAALSYYAIFSLAPLLIIIIFIIGLITGADSAKGQVNSQISGFIGEEGAQFVEGIVNNTNQASGVSVASFIAVVSLIMGAVGIYEQLRFSCNFIWDVNSENQKEGIKYVVKNKLWSILSVFGISSIFLVVLGASSFFSFALAFFKLSHNSLELINQLFFSIIVSFLFAIIYQIALEVKVAWKPILIGAFTAGFLFTVAKVLLGLYLSQSNVFSVYSSSSSLVLLILWIYYCTQIVFFGLEVSKVIAKKMLS